MLPRPLCSIFFLLVLMVLVLLMLVLLGLVLVLMLVVLVLLMFHADYVVDVAEIVRILNFLKKN